MVAVFHFDPHSGTGQNNVPPDLHSGIICHPEIAAMIQQFFSWISQLVVPKQEKLQFGTHIEVIKTKLFHPLQLSFQHQERIPFESTSVGVVDVAKHGGHPIRVLRTVGKQSERVRDRFGHQITFFDAHESFDGRSVKSHTFVQSPFHLRFVDVKRHHIYEARH